MKIYAYSYGNKQRRKLKGNYINNTTVTEEKKIL